MTNRHQYFLVCEQYAGGSFLKPYLQHPSPSEPPSLILETAYALKKLVDVSLYNKQFWLFSGCFLLIGFAHGWKESDVTNSVSEHFVLAISYGIFAFCAICAICVGAYFYNVIFWAVFAKLDINYSKKMIALERGSWRNPVSFIIVSNLAGLMSFLAPVAIVFVPIILFINVFKA